MVIGLIPMDERPVNYILPGEIAELSSTVVVTPPRCALGRMRTSGDAGLLQAWLWEQVEQMDGLVVSMDQLVHGGLVPSRIDATPLTELVQRANVLREVKERLPDLPVYAFGAVMRLSDSNDASEEPEYWAQYGREVAALYAAIHNSGSPRDHQNLGSRLPAEIRGDVGRRRLRNHIVNLMTIEMVSEGVLDLAVVPSDDTARWSAGAQEQEWLGTWKRRLGIGPELLSYPGADEVAAVLVARMSSRVKTGAIASVSVACAVGGGLDRTALFEDRPVDATVRGQLGAVGAREVTGPEADVVLVVHPPDRESLDLSRSRLQVTPERLESARATADLVDSLVRSGRNVALADVAHANGADELLARRLSESGSLPRLIAYGAWNTAGNTIGSVLATAICTELIGPRSSISRKVLGRRVIEDWLYMSRLRALEKDRTTSVAVDHTPDLRPTEARTLEVALARELAGVPGFGNHLRIRPESLTFPWNRSFEIDFDIDFLDQLGEGCP